MRHIMLIFLFCTICLGEVLTIYYSADRTGAKSSGNSIEMGMRVALSEVGNVVNGDTIHIKVLDHRGSTPRFTQHCKQFLTDSTAFVMVGGLHSPPIIKNRDFINKNRILMLVPWAAAGLITRYPSSENWIFRLSIDDTKAGELITRHAIDKEKFTKPALLLEETGWGRSNLKTMTNALKKRGILNPLVEWFNWNLGIHQAKVILRKIKQSGADVVFFVGNTNEGKVIMQAMISLPEEERLPIRSHWGITGGDFPVIIGPEERKKIDLQFIQSSYSFCSVKQNPFSKSVMKTIVDMYPDIDECCQLKAPVGFIHSYDLTRILINALKEAPREGSIASYRDHIRLQLEQLSSPVEGLVKVYNRPFSVWSEENQDAHEALSIEDWSMARYTEENTIQILE